MFIINAKRILRLGLVNFWRNGSVSFASVLIMTAALLVISTLMFGKVIFSSTLNELKNKVDINVYFISSATEQEIFDLKTKIETLPEVSFVEYSSKDEEYEKFKIRHQDDELTLQSLEEIGMNPFGAVLNIQAKEPSQYAGIANFLEETKNQNSLTPIDRINYNKNKVAIETLARITGASQKLGFTLTFFAVIVAILITFNTIRLTIFMAREEISVMRLVGASTRYIRGPFVVTGLLYGLVSTILTIIILLPLLYWAGPHTANLGTGVNLFDYFKGNFFTVTGALLLSGFVIGSLSSYLATKKYLKI